MTVTPEAQVEFLNDIQRLLVEGQFTATYKFALILALADIAVERGVDNGSAFEIETNAIAEKFIQYYWRHVRPFSHGSGEVVLLRQNTGKDPAVIGELKRLSDQGVSTLIDLKNHCEWPRLIRRIRQTICNQPLRYLPTLGRMRHSFLYDDDPRIQAGSIVEKIRLKPGVVYCLRRFYGLITDIVRGAWVRYARRYNSDLLGEPTDLDEFLFGSERAGLQVYVPILREIQASRCFYCDREMRGELVHVDHFIPWSIYPVDLGHNFVLAHSTCNSAKADHLAAASHITKWMGRNETLGRDLEREFDGLRIVHNQQASLHVTQWAYGRAGTGTMTWIRSSEFEPLPEDWIGLLVAA